MSSIRIRPPSDDGRWTIEWYAAYGDGVWVLLHGGRIVSNARLQVAGASGPTAGR